MTAKAYDPHDPMELVGVALPSDAAALDEMARCLVEEYVRAGWDEARLLALFRNPFYRALHMIYREGGEEYVKAIIAEASVQWGVRQATVGEEASGDA